VALFGISLASPGSDGARLDVSVGVHHLDLVVSSLERSVAFYRELLDPLGYARIGDIVGERGEPVVYVSGGGSSIGVREARVGGDYDRYRIGVHDRLRGVVARRDRRALQMGAGARSGDRVAPEGIRLHARLLRVLLLRPRRIKLEVVHAPLEQGSAG
jgi:catechol 2,3-dioxygenase-like lactoylglutathione lyase family enzyme